MTSICGSGHNEERIRTCGGKHRICFKIIEIGDWNMMATAIVNVPHNLNCGSIVMVQCIVQDDTGNNKYILIGDVTNNMDAKIDKIDNTNVIISRKSGGLFQNVNFDSTSYNRGFITILYTT